MAKKQTRKLLKMDATGATLGGPITGGTINTAPLARNDPANYNSAGNTPLAAPPLKGKARKQALKLLPKEARPAAKSAMKTANTQYRRDQKYDRTIGTAFNPIMSPVTRPDLSNPALGPGRPDTQMFGLGPYNDQALRLSYGGQPPPGAMAARAPGAPPPMGPMPGFGGGGAPGAFPPPGPPPMMGGPPPGLPPGAGMAPGQMPGMMPPGMPGMPPNPFTPQPMQGGGLQPMDPQQMAAIRARMAMMPPNRMGLA